MLVHRLALRVSLLLEAGYHMSGGSPNIERSAPWTLDCVDNSTSKDPLGFKDGVNVLSFLRVNITLHGTPVFHAAVSPLHTSLITFPCIARTGKTDLLVLPVLSWAPPPLFWSVFHESCLLKLWRVLIILQNHLCSLMH